MELAMKGSCEVLKIVSDKKIQKNLWEVYLSELGPKINSETAIPQQCLGSFKIFQDVLLDPDFKKFILFSEEKKIIGLALSSNNFKKIIKKAGIALNFERYESIFPEEYKQKIIHYIPVTCILKNHQDLGHMNTLGEALIKEINKDQGLAAFDFAEEKNAGLDEMVVYIARETGLRPDAKITLIGRQTFVVIG